MRRWDWIARGSLAAFAVPASIAVSAACGTDEHAPMHNGPKADAGDAGDGAALGNDAADAGSPEGEADAGDGGFLSYGIDCPLPSSSALPAGSPRILVLGPEYPNAIALAEHLQGMLDADPAFESPEVVGQTIDQPGDGGSLAQGSSLMYFFYAPASRATRLSALSSPWSYVVLLEQTNFALGYPELYFEGVRTLGCNARAVGATPIVLMTGSPNGNQQETAERGEIAYRVANGTGSVLSPAGYAWASLEADAGSAAVPAVQMDTYLAAATLYSTVTGRDASITGYVPSGGNKALAAQISAHALGVVKSEAAKVHYQSPYQGVVRMETKPPGGTFRFLVYGTSSEALWASNMNTILPKAGFAAQGTTLAAPAGSPFCESACLDAATPPLQQQPYDLLYARYYSVSASTFAAIGPQPELQVQVWDRHADGVPADGVAAVQMMEQMSTSTYAQAKALGLAHTPYHLMFSKLKTMRPSVQLTSDGTHATPTVAYGQATMSVVSRTGIQTSTAGLDSDTALCSQLADETIRQLSALSVSGAFVPDDPATRPAIK